MNKAKLIISLDTEYSWGRISETEQRKYFPLYSKTKGVIDDLLTLFDQYNAPVTWAIVGRLVDGGVKKNPYFEKDLSNFFPEITTDEIYGDQELNSPSNSFITDATLVERILNANVEHEIATHTYNHIYYDAITDSSIIDEDLKASKEIFSEQNALVESMVFTKNQIGYKDILKKNGILTYRGGYVRKFDNWPSWIQRILLLADNFLPTAPEVVNPHYSDEGLVEIPGSMLYRQSPFGMRKYFPLKILTDKMIAGLNKAVLKNKILHIWIHPYNFGFKKKEHLAGLEKILSHANELSSKNLLEIATMKTVADEFRVKTPFTKNK